MEAGLEIRLKEIFEKMDKKLQAECKRVGERIPYTTQNGLYETDMRDENLAWWTNGFWAGMLWQMYHATENPLYRRTAEYSEKAFDKTLEEFEGLHHDVGFQFLHTAVADYRLTGNKRSRVRGLHAAALLAGRFNGAGNYIRAWNKDLPGWLIVDCLMNIPLLYWASEEMGDPRFAYVADSHAHTAMRLLVREDGSYNHIAVCDPDTGELLELPGGQGFKSGSSWSRGQAWALYGFALEYRHTGKKEYLDTAKKAAHYFIANVAATGYVSLCDFRAPKEPVYWDTTAAACAVCGLLEIEEAVGELEKPLYHDSAVKILMALEEKHCNWDVETDSILQNGTEAYGRDHATHIPIIYGDYFFVEGVLRLLGKSFMIW